MRFDDFSASIRARVFEGDEPENLVDSHKLWIKDALIQLQKKVRCLQSDNLEKIPQCGTYYLCGQSVFCAPRGYLSKLYTVDSDGCSRIDYFPVTKEEMDCLSGAYNQEVSILHPYGYFLDDNTGLYTAFPDLGIPGMEVPDDTIDKPCRAQVGYWTLHKRNIHVFPQMQWDETACIEFDGIKRSFADDDTVDYDREVEEAVETWLRYKVASVEDCDPAKAREHLEGPLGTQGEGFNGLVATLIHDCEKERRIPKPNYCFSNC